MVYNYVLFLQDETMNVTILVGSVLNSNNDKSRQDQVQFKFLTRKLLISPLIYDVFSFACLEQALGMMPSNSSGQISGSKYGK